MSFNNVRKSHPQAAKLFQILAFFNPDGVLIDFLQSGVEGFPDDLQPLLYSQIGLSRALIELEKYSLLRWNRVTKTVAIHRLVQAVIRDEMSKGTRMTLCDNILDICDESFTKACTKTGPLCRGCVGQIISPLLNIESLRTMKLVYNMERVSRYLLEDGKYNDLAKLIVQICSVLGGEDDLSTLRSMFHLAETYRLQGKLIEAARMGEEVMAKNIMMRNYDSPWTLRTMRHLAATYRMQGKLTDAARVLEKLPKYTTIVPANHPDIVDDLVGMYEEQGNLKEAVNILEETLANWAVLGDESLSKFSLIFDLARMYRQQGRLKIAAEMLEQMLQDAAIFGDEHCNLLNAYFSYIYGQKRKLTDAAKLHEQVLAKAQAFFVYDHCTETLSSMSNVAWIYRRQGRFAEAAKLYEQILATMEAVFGENHPDTVAAWGGLALTYVQHGRMRDAVRLGWVIMKKYWTNQK